MLKAEGFKNAKTRFEVLDANKTTCALLQLEPITGLKHQIRVHLAEGLKCPILGDHKFSSDIHQPQVTYCNPRCNIRLNGKGHIQTHYLPRLSLQVLLD